MTIMLSFLAIVCCVVGTHCVSLHRFLPRSGSLLYYPRNSMKRNPINQQRRIKLNLMNQESFLNDARELCQEMTMFPTKFINFNARLIFAEHKEMNDYIKTHNQFVDVKKSAPESIIEWSPFTVSVPISGHDTCIFELDTSTKTGSDGKGDAVRIVGLSDEVKVNHEYPLDDETKFVELIFVDHYVGARVVEESEPIRRTLLKVLKQADTFWVSFDRQISNVTFGVTLDE